MEDHNKKKEEQSMNEEATNQQQQQQQQQQLQFSQFMEQVDADRAFAFALQQQESPFTMLETINGETYDDEAEEAEEEDEEEEIESSSSHDFDGNFESQEFEAEFEFTVDDDDEGSYTDDQFEEDDIDPDEMSYEELMALGEIVGEESRGLPVEQIASCLAPFVHKCIQSKTIIERCVICQIEYEEGEQLAALQCQHPFHGDCINQWLQIKKVCPICSTEVAPQPPSSTHGKKI